MLSIRGPISRAIFRRWSSDDGRGRDVDPPDSRIHVDLASSGDYDTLDFSDSFVIGRADSSDVQLDDERVSARHAEVYRVGGLWWVRDLESGGGTFLDEEPIEAAPLSGSSVLQLGTDGPRLWIW